MQKRYKLSKTRASLAAEYMPLARMLAKFFVQARPPWQKALYIPELEGEGFLALCKASRTYDKKRLPYPKAYFARACMNAMYKWIRRATRSPAEWKVSLEEAEHLMPVIEHPEYLQLAIADLDDDERKLAEDRFQSGETLRQISERHQISLRVASLRSRDLAKKLAEALEIKLQQPDGARECRLRGSNQSLPSGSAASSRPRRPKQ